MVLLKIRMRRTDAACVDALSQPNDWMVQKPPSYLPLHWLHARLGNFGFFLASPTVASKMTVVSACSGVGIPKSDNGYAVQDSLVDRITSSSPSGRRSIKSIIVPAAGSKFVSSQSGDAK